MRKTALALMMFATPVYAQQSPAPPAEEGWSLMERGAKLLFDGLMSEMEPALDDMGRALAQMEPALRDLVTMLGDIRFYHAPEKQPNGDILIRRKTEAEQRLEGLTGPEIEL